MSHFVFLSAPPWLSLFLAGRAADRASALLFAELQLPLQEGPGSPFRTDQTELLIAVLSLFSTTKSRAVVVWTLAWRSAEDAHQEPTRILPSNTMCATPSTKVSLPLILTPDISLQLRRIPKHECDSNGTALTQIAPKLTYLA